jgi:hypothetical protein
MWLSCRDTVREESHSRSDAITAGSEILLSLDLFPLPRHVIVRSHRDRAERETVRAEW